MDDGMDSVLPVLDARTRKSHSVMLQAFARVGQNSIAISLGKSDATISRLKSQDLQMFALLLTALGLKPVPVTAKCYDPATFAAMQQLALERLSRASDHSADTGIDWGAA